MDDETEQLLQNFPVDERVTCGQYVKKRVRKCWSVKTLKKRVPIVDWLPKYKLSFVIQDIIAGITVGLTAIPQSIAYAVIAGLPPQYGLYSAFLGAYVYLVFGSCKDLTIGPTAILSAFVAKYVKNYNADFAVLATFLSGCVIFVLGFFQLGFLVDFISNPVISGFTTAASLQIASSQLKTFFAISGIVVVLALSLLTDTFYYIPRSSLAALIMVAMYYMMDFAIIGTLWKSRKLMVLLVTMLACLGIGLEYGICAGIIADVVVLLYRNYRVPITISTTKIGNTEAMIITARGPLLYCSAEYISNKLQKVTKAVEIVIFDGSHVTTVDTSVVKSLNVIIEDVEKQNCKMFLWNFPTPIREMWDKLASTGSHFIQGVNLEALVNERIAQIPILADV